MQTTRRNALLGLFRIATTAAASAAVIKAAPRTKTLVASHWPTPRFIQDYSRFIRVGDIVTLDNGHRWECRSITLGVAEKPLEQGAWYLSHQEITGHLQKPGSFSRMAVVGATINIPFPYQISQTLGYGNIKMRRITNLTIADARRAGYEVA